MPPARTGLNRERPEGDVGALVAEAGVLGVQPFPGVAEVAEELGAALAPVPYLSTVVLAGTALVVAGDEEAAAEHLAPIASGSVVATLAVTEDSGRWDEADVLVGVEAARSAAAAAVAAVDGDGRDDLGLLASTAKAYCCEAFVRAASESIQVHGGLGLTWDHDAHLYFKRARSSALLLGDPAWHRERVARRLAL